MKYRVTGSNRETGARMMLEIEADSKAAAERKAAGSGMDVRHAEEMTDAFRTTSTDRDHRSDGGGKIVIIVFILVAAAVVYFLWPKLKGIF